MRRRVLSLLIVAVFLALLVAFGAKVLQEGALGCARVFDRAAYTDPDELERFGFTEPAPTEHVFTDSAYDAVFPDLYEPANGEAESE